MQFVYLLKSLIQPNQLYIGNTTNMISRLAAHNAGKAYHTSKYRPWKLQICIMFDDDNKAFEFEKYLKSGSGRAFIHQRLL